MKINLREIREKAQRPDEHGKTKAITRDELSLMLSDKVDRKIHSTQIVRFEEDPGSVPFDLLIPWLQCLGTTMEEQLLAAIKVPEKIIDAGDPYAKLVSRIDLLRDYLNNAVDSSVHVQREAANGLPTLAEILQITNVIGRKPNIVLSGAFDAGKSTLANWLLSSHSLPERYQPTTAVVTYVKHIDEKPDWLKEDVILLNEQFNPDCWNEEGHINGSKVLSGDLGTLKEYGTHNPNRDEQTAENALVFLNSPILKSCNIIDYPGFQNNEDDTKRAEKAYRNIDVLVYASAFGGFMNGPDLAILREFLRRLPPYESVSTDFPTLGNLFIVATHAGPQIKDEHVPGALNIAADRIWRELHEHEIAVRSAETSRTITRDVIRSRMFTFWRESAERTKLLTQSITELLSNSLPACIEIEANKKILDFKNNADFRLSTVIDTYERILSDLDQAKELYEQKLAEEPARVKHLEQLRRALTAVVNENKAGHLAEFHQIYASKMDTEAIEKMIKERYEDKKEAQQHMASYVISSIQADSEQVLKSRSAQVTNLVEDYIATYDKSLIFELSGGEATSMPFDSRGSFIGGLAGLGSIGALTMWASSLGNLGGYIIAAKAVSILSALGIGVGGTASAMAGIAALGGPITLVVALGAALFFLAKVFFGESWQARLAKQIVDHAKKKNIKEQLEQSINNFWDNTIIAFERGAKQMEEDYRNELKKFGQVLKRPEKIKEAEEMLVRYKKAKDFFSGMPWFLLGTR